MSHCSSFVEAIVDLPCSVNKGLAVSCPQPGCHYPNSLWPGTIYQIPVPGRYGQKHPGISLFLFTVWLEVMINLLENKYCRDCIPDMLSVA